jgi:ribonucleoside-diphosphate reductase alpha chain
MSMNNYQEYIHKRTYARYDEEKGRRENWPETVNRYVTYMKGRVPKNAQSKFPWEEIEAAIRDMDVMPSMRAMQTAGPALDKDNVAGYNCAYLPIEHPRCFDEALYILMCGTGVGFSVERTYIDKLPEVPDGIVQSETVIKVRDSKRGWQDAFRELIALLYSGQRPQWDLGGIRPAGTRLRTFGGRASGPGPLEDLFRFTCELFQGAKGRRLTSLECHDLMCKIAEVVVCGGVRRSALISLSNLTDNRMRNAKSGDWYTTDRQRALANNSACYTQKPDYGAFAEEWLALYRSKSGERGIFNREAARATVERIGRRDPDHEWGTNPCSEIILRPYQFC